MTTELLPVITPEQEKLVLWSERQMITGFFFHGVNSAIPFFEQENPSKYRNKENGEEYANFLEMYKQFSEEEKQNVIQALSKRIYRKTTDIQVGELVTDGESVGYAFDFNYQRRTFYLYTSRKNRSFGHTHKIDDFYQLKIAQ